MDTMWYVVPKEVRWAICHTRGNFWKVWCVAPKETLTQCHRSWWKKVCSDVICHSQKNFTSMYVSQLRKFYNNVMCCMEGNFDTMWYVTQKETFTHYNMGTKGKLEGNFGMMPYVTPKEVWWVICHASGKFWKVYGIVICSDHKKFIVMWCVATKKCLQQCEMSRLEKVYSNVIHCKGASSCAMRK
jgi:hypothetical protein